MAAPTYFSAADDALCTVSALQAERPSCDGYFVTATNVGANATDGGEVTLTDAVPAGLVVKQVRLFWSEYHTGSKEKEDLATTFPGTCTISPVRCVVPEAFFAAHGGPVRPDGTLKMDVYVTVEESASPGPLTNVVSVSGGDATASEDSEVNNIAEASPAFGFSALRSSTTDLAGEPSEQAGEHPYELKTTMDFNNVFRTSPSSGFFALSVEDLKDVVVDLPLGMAGSAVSAPTCTLAELSSEPEPETTGCPADSIVGHILTEPLGLESADTPVYNMVTEPGHAAEFGFHDEVKGTHVLYASLAPTPAGYVLQVTAHETPQLTLTDIVSNFYGNPAERDKSGASPVPTFTNPANCSGEPLVTNVYVDSWQKPGGWNPNGTPNLEGPGWVHGTASALPVTGCNLLRFQPRIETSASSDRADSPTGLEVDLKVPQSSGTSTLATPPLRDAVVTLPTGFAVNPSSANGLEACSLEQVGMSAAGVPNASAPACPEASQIGTVELETPALPGVLHGAIYVAKQGENPFGSLLAIYIVVDDQKTGVMVKLVGEVHADPSTGQLTTTIENAPQFPFSELRTHFFGGNDAPLSTPTQCGGYTTTTTLTPWSAPDSGPPSTPTFPVAISQGANGAPCTSSEAQEPSAPSLSAGTTNNQAGQFSPLTLTLSRQDGQQFFGSFGLTAPEGLLGVIKNVTPCQEPQAASGDCGPQSLIGETSAAVGAGPQPYWVRAGMVYLTGPYNGGPFGLSIVVPTVAGPYTLTGNGGPGREIVRASIRVNPVTAQITVLTDALPNILEGIPLQIRTIIATINRSNFVFNPTSCAKMSLTVSVTSPVGATVSAASRFQAADCAQLAFKPEFKVAGSGKTTRRYGASLKLTLSYPKAAWGTQANIRSAKIVLPRQLPARESTLKLACAQATFRANPAACPAAARVGQVLVHTPVLPVPLIGPAYFVSHGGVAFPELVFVLQGDGVTVDVGAETFISSKGITSSTLRSTPDVPIENFTLTLPSGPYSALAAPDGLCNLTKTITVKHKRVVTTNGRRHTIVRKTRKRVSAQLLVPTTFTAQNGMTSNQDAVLAVSGCKRRKK